MFFLNCKCFWPLFCDLFYTALFVHEVWPRCGLSLAFWEKVSASHHPPVYIGGDWLLFTPVPNCIFRFRLWKSTWHLSRLSNPNKHFFGYNSALKTSTLAICFACGETCLTHEMTMMLKVNRAFQCIIPSVWVMKKHHSSPKKVSTMESSPNRGIWASEPNLSNMEPYFLIFPPKSDSVLYAWVCAWQFVWYGSTNSHEAEIVHDAKCLIHVHKGPWRWCVVQIVVNVVLGILNEGQMKEWQEKESWSICG